MDWQMSECRYPKRAAEGEGCKLDFVQLVSDANQHLTLVDDNHRRTGQTFFVIRSVDNSSCRRTPVIQVALRRVTRVHNRTDFSMRTL